MVMDVADSVARLPDRDSILDIELPAPSVASLATTVAASDVASTTQLDEDEALGPSAEAFRAAVPSAPILTPPRIGTTPATSRETVVLRQDPGSVNTSVGVCQRWLLRRSTLLQ